MVMFAVFFLGLLINISAVSGLSISPEISVERRSFVSKSVASLPLIATGFGIPSSANAEINIEGYEDGPRGLKYKVIKPATDPASPSPQRAQKVKAKYTLYLNGFPDDNPNAKKVDSSKGPFGEKPLEFVAGVSQVIKGWDLTVLDMKVGEERRIVVPSDLGYGEKGAGGAIPGGATLYFDMELVEIGEMSKLGPQQLKWLEDNPL
jgi:peptidylprolyl isomerase